MPNEAFFEGFELNTAIPEISKKWKTSDGSSLSEDDKVRITKGNLVIKHLKQGNLSKVFGGDDSGNIWSFIADKKYLRDVIDAFRNGLPSSSSPTTDEKDCPYI